MLSEKDKKKIREYSKKILTYKLMQTRGYARLVRKTKDERAMRLLSELASNELKDSELWSASLADLDERAGKSIRSSFFNRRVALMMSILGRRGFFEWAIIAEDESLEELALYVENIEDTDVSEYWTRMASDERLHIERIKKEVLGMEAWEMGGGGGVRDVIFGANDGLVSILALVAGVYGAVTESYLIFIAGFTGAVAGAMSMGAGSYLSAKSDNEVKERENEKKGIRKKRTPEEEKEALIGFYQTKGFKREEAQAITERVRAKMELAAEYTIGEEVGLVAEESWPPWKAAVLTGLSFAIVSLIPILPFVFMKVTPAVLTAVAASIVSLFGVGASKAIFTRKSWIRSGLEMMAIGTLAAAATYLIGLLIPV